MVERIPEAFLARLSELIEAHMGLHFPLDRWKDIERAVNKAVPALGCRDVRSCVQQLLDSAWSDEQVEILATYLTIGETHFFRHEKVFEILQEQILPELMLSRGTTTRHLRIWSAGCATGEEPYSIAMVVQKTLADLRSWNVTILATDINRACLQKAERAVYNQWSFRTVPEGIKERYFLETESGSEVVPAIRSMVNFSHFNLAKHASLKMPSDAEALDVIFCRNVLMYFSPERQEQVVGNLCRSLADGGWLIVSPAEASCVLHPELTTVNFPGAILYRKGPRPGADVCLNRFSFPEAIIVRTPPESSPQFDDCCIQSTAEPVGDSGWSSWAADIQSSLEELAHLFPDPPPHETPDSQAAPEADPYEESLVLFEQGRYAAAVDKLLRCLSDNRFENGRTGKAMGLLARAYANQGRLDEALEWSEKTIAADKLNSDFHYLHGTILQEKGRFDEAVTSMTRAVFLEPNLVMAHFSLGNLARLRARQKDAERHYRVALRILEKFGEDAAVPATEGMTAGRLTELILAITTKETANGKS